MNTKTSSACLAEEVSPYDLLGYAPPAADLGPLLERLGAGGMGAVHRAKQLSLSRYVAVKQVLDVEDPRQLLALRHEAEILSRLEHRCIPAVHGMISLDGAQALVMQEIRGCSWADRLKDPNARGLLEERLDFFGDLLETTAFAHALDILHLDIKPSNVMIGDDDSLFLMDWGSAIAGSDNGKRKQGPCAIMASRPYAAPELLFGFLGNPSQQSDVYLLGATLYHVVTGRPPRGCDDLDSERIGTWEVATRLPDFGDEWPSELAAICRRALAPLPAERFSSAAEMCIAMARYHANSGARHLAERGDALRRQFRCLLQQQGITESSMRCFERCCFAYQEALEIAPALKEASLGYRIAVEDMAEVHLREDKPGAAESMLLQHGVRESQLLDEAQAARRQAQSDRVDAESLRRRVDPRTAQSERRKLLVGVALIWTVVAALLALFAPRTSFASQLTGHLVYVAAAAVIGWRERRWIRASMANQALYAILALAGVTALTFNLGLILLGLSPEQTLAAQLMIFGVVNLAAVWRVEPGAWPTGLAYVAAFLMSCANSELSFWAMSASNAFLLANILCLRSEDEGGEAAR